VRGAVAVGVAAALADAALAAAALAAEALAAAWLARCPAAGADWIAWWLVAWPTNSNAA